MHWAGQNGEGHCQSASKPRASSEIARFFLRIIPSHVIPYAGHLSPGRDCFQARRSLTRADPGNPLSDPGRRVEATRFLRRTNRWRRLLPVDVSPRGNAYPRSACGAAAAQISRPSTNPDAKSRLRRTPARRADALVLSANAWPLSHALPSGPCLRQGGLFGPLRHRIDGTTMTCIRTTKGDECHGLHRSPVAVCF